MHCSPPPPSLFRFVYTYPVIGIPQGPVSTNISELQKLNLSSFITLANSDFSVFKISRSVFFLHTGPQLLKTTLCLTCCYVHQIIHQVEEEVSKSLSTFGEILEETTSPWFRFSYVYMRLPCSHCDLSENLHFRVLTCGLHLHQELFRRLCFFSYILILMYI